MTNKKYDKDSQGFNIINRKQYKPITLMIDENDYPEIARKAAAKGLTPTTYCRLLCLGKLGE